MSTGAAGVVVVPAALLAVPVLVAAGAVYGMVAAGRAIHEQILRGHQQRVSAEKTRYERLVQEVRKLADACQDLGLDSISTDPAPHGDDHTISSASAYAAALIEVNDAMEARVRAKQAEVDGECRALAAEESRIAAQHADRAVLARAAAQLGMDGDALTEIPDSTIRKASVRARAVADALVKQNETFQSAIGVAYRAQATARDRRTDAALVAGHATQSWAEARAEQQRVQAESKRRLLLDRLAAAYGSLPSGFEVPSDLEAQIASFREAAEPTDRQFEQIDKRLVRVTDTAVLRSSLDQALRRVKERAARISAFEFHGRSEALQMRATALPGDADWNARREVDQDLTALERDLTAREAEVLALHARVVALKAIYEAFEDQGLGLSSQELELWTPLNGELQRRGAESRQEYPLNPDEVLVRVKGSRKAVRIHASNQADRPERVEFAVDQVWLGQRPDGPIVDVDSADHDQVCEAVKAALALLPEHGVAVDGVQVDETPFDPDLPVIGIGQNLEAILKGEEQTRAAATQPVEEGHQNVRYADAPEN
jgi:hypothetical protein